MKSAIRKGTYRDVPGFHVTGPNDQRVFVETRRQADLVKRVFETHDTRTAAGFDAMTDAMFGCEPLWWDTEAS